MNGRPAVGFEFPSEREIDLTGIEVSYSLCAIWERLAIVWRSEFPSEAPKFVGMVKGER